MTSRPHRRHVPLMLPAVVLGCSLAVPVTGWCEGPDGSVPTDRDAAAAESQETGAARIQAERDLLRAEVERLRATIEDAERKRLEQALTDADARAERLDARLASLLELSHTMQSERSVLRAELGEMRTRAESAEARVQRVLQERESALETNLALQAQKRDAESRLETEMQRVADQLLQIEALQADLVSAHEAVRTLDAQRAEAHARAEALEQRLAECSDGGEPNQEAAPAQPTPSADEGQ